MTFYHNVALIPFIVDVEIWLFYKILRETLYFYGLIKSVKRVQANHAKSLLNWLLWFPNIHVLVPCRRISLGLWKLLIWNFDRLSDVEDCIRLIHILFSQDDFLSLQDLLVVYNLSIFIQNQNIIVFICHHHSFFFTAFYNRYVDDLLRIYQNLLLKNYFCVLSKVKN